MEKIDFIKEISTAFEGGDMKELQKTVETLVEYQNMVQSNMEKYATALKVEKERHQEYSSEIINSIKVNQQDATNLATASSFLMGLSKSSKEVSAVVDEVVKGKDNK